MKRKPHRPDPAKRKLSYARVYPHPQLPHRALIRCGPLTLPCSIGKNGVTHLKREGDWATPVGPLPLMDLIVRRDRIAGPRTSIPAFAMSRSHMWDENPRHGTYNQLLHAAPTWLGDHLWREDRLYNIVGIFDWNITARGAYRGSAIFLHLCRPNFGPTAGCIALRPGDLNRLLGILAPDAVFDVAPKPRKMRVED